MARVTVEDCLEKVENRFALVLMVSKRVKQLLKGAESVLDSKYNLDNKHIVSALREVAAGKITYEVDLSHLETINRIEQDLQR